MATLIDILEYGRIKANEREVYPARGLRFDWIVAILSTFLVGGLYLDGWAHNHGKVDQSFFTPWHAVMYGVMFLVAAFLFVSMIRNRVKGFAWPRLLPQGYLLSWLGVVIFVLGGVGDMIWHTLFGIEVSVDALLSPTHLILALGGVLIIGGPLRAAGMNLPQDGSRDWTTMTPMLLSVTALLSVLTFFTQFVHPLVDTLAAKGYSPRPDPFFTQALGVAGILIQAALLMGLVLLIVRRWTLPFGALALILTLNSLLVSVLNDQYALIMVALATGLIADVLLWRLRPLSDKPVRFYLFAFVVPVVFYALYFLTLLVTRGLDWTIHMWAGSIVMAGIVGLLLSFVMVPPLNAGRNESSS
jgi:hypothetical protein